MHSDLGGAAAGRLPAAADPIQLPGCYSPFIYPTWTVRIPTPHMDRSHPTPWPVRLPPQEADEIVAIGYLNALFVVARSIGFCGHALDQKRLQQPLYRHPWEDVLYTS